jgi:hypothetical protein
VVLRVGMIVAVSALASVAQTSPRSVTPEANRGEATIEDRVRSTVATGGMVRARRYIRSEATPFVLCLPCARNPIYCDPS